MMTKKMKEVTKVAAAKKEVELSRKLQKSASIVSATLADADPIKVLTNSVTSKHNNTAPREALAALYDLAVKMHSSRLPYYAPKLMTSEKEHITLEQIWGQMNVLLRPVLRRLQDNVRKSQQMFGSNRINTAKESTFATTTKKKTKEEIKQINTSATDENDGESKNSSSSNSEHNMESVSTSETDESDLDEEIAELLAKSEARKRNRNGLAIVTNNKSSKKDKSVDKSGNDWRYAFGKVNDEDEQWGEEADDNGTHNNDINAGEDDDNDDEITALKKNNELDDKEEDLAALREMYGEDFVDDGQGFIGDGDDPDMEEDIELDDPSNEVTNDDDNEYKSYQQEQLEQSNLFQPRDGHFYGSDNILEENSELNGFNLDNNASESAIDGRARDIDSNDIAALMEEDTELKEALNNPNLTALEKERLREQKMIELLEQRRLYGTDWAMAGESAANKRPREALLEINDLEFDHGMKAVPVITPAITAQLEERIKRRILDSRYDDVERKTAISSADDLVSTKTDPALDSQKSKLSLMDLYEKEYLEKARLAAEQSGAASAAAASSADPLTEIEKDELRAIQMWKRLGQHLDALSNFYFTPKPAQQDLEARVRAVESQAPALVLESSGNFAANRADALAPQDLYRASSRRFHDVGSAELLPRERRALRRSKKEHGEKVKSIVEAKKVALQQKAKKKHNNDDKTSSESHSNINNNKVDNGFSTSSAHDSNKRRR